MRPLVALRTRRARRSGDVLLITSGDLEIVEAVLEMLLIHTNDLNIVLNITVIVTHILSRENITFHHEVATEPCTSPDPLTHDRDTIDSLSVEECTRDIVDL